MKIIGRKILSYFFALFCCWNTAANALIYSQPHDGSSIVGSLQTVQVQPGETLSDIAERYDMGFYEITEANPGIDPEDMHPGTMLIIPSKFMLPHELRNNIVVNLAELRLYYSTDNKVYTFPLGIGTEDWQTPLGKFKIVQKIKDPKWVVPDSIREFRAKNGEDLPKIVGIGPDNPLGKFALRLSDPTYLIHGTIDPVAIGRRSTAGCIRMYPPDIETLYSNARIGTKVVIINEPYKFNYANGTWHFEAHLPLSEERMTMTDYSEAITAADEVAKQHKHSLSIETDKITQLAKEHLGIPLAVT